MSDVKTATTAAGVAHVTIDRPEQRNALSMSVISELNAAFASLAGEPNIRAVVLTGAGRAFSAGGDINWMQGVLNDPEGAGREEAAEILGLIERIERTPCPVIARINGAAFGAAFGLISAADIAIAVEDAKFGLSGVRLGLVPGPILPSVIRRIGPAAARAFCLTGATLDAETAMRAGLVHRVVKPGALDRAVTDALAEILRSSPAAVAATKRAMRAMAAAPQGEWAALGMEAIIASWKTEDAREGVHAFLEKRAPSWSPEG